MIIMLKIRNKLLNLNKIQIKRNMNLLNIKKIKSKKIKMIKMVINLKLRMKVKIV